MDPLIIATCASIMSACALYLALRNAHSIGVLDARIEHGITRDDLDKLHHRINAMTEKIGGLQSSVQGQGAQLSRIDTYLREHK